MLNDATVEHLANYTPSERTAYWSDQYDEQLLEILHAALTEKDLDLYRCRALAAEVAKHVVHKRTESRLRPLDDHLTEVVSRRTLPIEKALRAAGFRGSRSLVRDTRDECVTRAGYSGGCALAAPYRDDSLSEGDRVGLYHRAIRIAETCALDDAFWASATTELWRERIASVGSGTPQ